MLALPVDDASLDGAVAWFSVIHLTNEQRPTAYEELARAVRPGGWLIVGFHVSGDTPVGPRGPGQVAEISTWWDEDVDLSFHFLDPTTEAASLEANGWQTVARLDREPMTETEAQTRRCYLLAQGVDPRLG